MAKTIILAVDGGGIKGVIPAYILSQLEKDLNNTPCYQKFDMVGGTSTGGIIACALTSPIVNNQYPMTAKQVLGMYQHNGNQIFVSQGSGDDYALYYGDDGNGNGIEPFLQKVLGDTTLKDAAANMKALGGKTKHVFTTCYTINSSGNAISQPVAGQDYGPYLFNWFDAAQNTGDNYAVWEAARGTSAAPTYFPVAQVGGGSAPRSGADSRWVVDGGVMSNNPAIWAISEAFRTGAATSLSDLVVISLGTGTYVGGAGLVTNHQGLPDPDDGNWGYYPWVGSDLKNLNGVENGRGAIINIITESVQLVSGKQMLAFAKSGLQYFRLEPTISKAQSQMDNISTANIQSLLNTAQSYIGTGGAGYATYQAVLKALQ